MFYPCIDISPTLVRHGTGDLQKTWPSIFIMVCLNFSLNLWGCQGFEKLDLKASGQVAQAVRPLSEIMKISLDCWQSLSRKTLESSWMVCGYFGPEHFHQFRDSNDGPGVKDFQEALKIADPADVLSGSSLTHSPQWCTTYCWQFQEQPPSGVYVCTPPKINIESETNGLEDDFPFPGGYPQVYIYLHIFFELNRFYSGKSFSRSTFVILQSQ